MRCRSFSSFSCCAALLVVGAFVALAVGQESPGDEKQRVIVPGTQVSVVPPPGFKPATSFDGFQRAELGASLMVIRLPGGSIDEVVGAMTAERLAEKGLDLLSRRVLPDRPHKAVLMKIQQPVGEQTYERWTLLTGNDSGAVMVAGIYPKAVAGQVGGALRAAVLSARWDPDVPVDPLDNLSFTLEILPPFEPAGRMSAMLMLSEGGVRESKYGPLIVTGPSLGLKLTAETLEDFSRTRVQNIDAVADVGVQRYDTLQIDGRLASETVGTGTWSDGPGSVVVYQVILLVDESYHDFLALLPAERREELLPVARKMARSYRPKAVAADGDGAADAKREAGAGQDGG